MHVIDAVLDSFSNIISIPQVFSSREDLFRHTLHSRPQLEIQNDVNPKKLKSIEELVTAIAAPHNIIRAKGGEVIPT
jgi:hypothetical protein